MRAGIALNCQTMFSAKFKKFYREGVSFRGVNCIPGKNVLKGGCLFLALCIHFLRAHKISQKKRRASVERDWYDHGRGRQYQKKEKMKMYLKVDECI